MIDLAKIKDSLARYVHNRCCAESDFGPDPNARYDWMSLSISSKHEPENQENEADTPEDPYISGIPFGIEPVLGAEILSGFLPDEQYYTEDPQYVRRPEKQVQINWPERSMQSVA